MIFTLIFNEANLLVRAYLMQSGPICRLCSENWLKTTDFGPLNKSRTIGKFLFPKYGSGQANCGGAYVVCCNLRLTKTEMHAGKN